MVCAVKNVLNSKKLTRKEMALFYDDEREYSWSFDTLHGYNNAYDRRRLDTITSIVTSTSPRSRRILDLGCGGGMFLKVLASQGFNVIGVDISKKLLRRVRLDGTGPELIVADAGVLLPFRNESFDLVICSELIEHIPDNKTTVGEINRILVNGGRALVDVPNLFMYDSLEARFRVVSRLIRFVNRFVAEPISPDAYSSHIHKHTFREWKKIIEQGELKVIEILAVFISPYVFEETQVLKQMERVFYGSKAIFNLQGSIERYLRSLWPFSMMGHFFLFVVRKGEKDGLPSFIPNRDV